MTNEYYYDSLPIGRENAISREALAALWDMSQDQVRHKIAELRSIDNGDDYIIFASSCPHSRGYYKTDDPAERRAFMAETRRRAINTFKPLKKARRIDRDASPIQTRIDNNLRVMRQIRGFTGRAFVEAVRAEYVYLDNALLSRIENSYVLPTQEMAQSMAKILNCDVSDLFPVENYL